MITRSTQTSKQDMDFEIVSALSGSKMHYVGHVESQSEITLMPSPTRPMPTRRPRPNPALEILTGCQRSALSRSVVTS